MKTHSAVHRANGSKEKYKISRFSSLSCSIFSPEEVIKLHMFDIIGVQEIFVEKCPHNFYVWKRSQDCILSWLFLIWPCLPRKQSIFYRVGLLWQDSLHPMFHFSLPRLPLPIKVYCYWGQIICCALHSCHDNVLKNASAWLSKLIHLFNNWGNSIYMR